jgi:hypothetical protein
MKVELLARWQDNSVTPEEAEEQELNRLLNGEAEEEVPKAKYIYRPIVLDVGDIKAFNKFDEVHTTLRMYEGDSLSAKVPYESFKEIYMSLLGASIKSIKMIEDIEAEETDEDIDNDDFETNLPFDEEE